MKKATYSDQSIVVDILTQAFCNNKSVNYAVGRKKKRIRRLMEYSFNLCYHSGEIYLSDDDVGCILFLDTERKKTTLKTLFWDLKLAICAIGLPNLRKVLYRENLVKKHHPKHRMRYLWYLGVQPSHQGLGIGSSLLRQTLSLNSLPVYLETSTLKNLPLYERFDFNVYKKIDLPSYQLYFLKKDPTHHAIC
ncbi:GNAT family N-acetyltransferase [Chitinophaga sp. Ak27]|uniref:GNAT family N-acetyltransferase n=1 Tax=Chitinophaga sp. Ak27 TaxID=2726116 RepID=UPI00145F5EB3|nr:GNAT family N-acetyltransferase [Chitinophaga sp. Ak27]NLU91391.1 GNAT family N-acetyltransferase [Chitinophaga sp. Ak27]